SVLEALCGLTSSAPWLNDAEADDDLGEEITARALALRIGSAMKTAIANPGSIKSEEARGLMNEIRTASRKVNRSGFRKEDRTSDACIQGLRHGALAAIDVVRELDRLLQALSDTSKDLDLASDQARFHEGFGALYAKTAQQQTI